MTYAMEIAKAVRRAQWCCGDNLISDEELKEIIASIQRPEPYGYFRAEPFGWADCAETDEGAVALYEEPPAPAESVNARLLAALEDCAWALNWHKEHNKGGPNDQHRIDKAYKAIAAAEQQQAQPLPELSDEQLFDIADKHYMPSEQYDSGLFFDPIVAMRAAIAADRELRGVK